MKQIKTIGILGLCMAAIGVASFAGAQSVRHDRMDARAARADIRRLQADRAQARMDHNWGKVAQDNRLISRDRQFTRKDTRKVIRATGIPPR